MLRRLIAIVAALVLLVEACGVVLVNWVLGLVARNQNMSMAGIDPHAISVGSWVAGALFGLFLVLCGILLLIIGIRDRALGRFARITLIACAVVHAVLGAFTVGLVGWQAFVYLMVVLALLVFVLVTYAKERPAQEVGAAPEDGPPGAPNGAPAAV
ncbi:hypothetical protein GCM10010331_03740 [Streptomyces xanthochromogenes]|uniref:hypothetical protein n=1 Tax=Streptomyces xanthochromogenes TaxID=67384 RepID=UPI001421E7BF|nr:hypothetical protein GCM10010331_03740 [Streptomyces xanthochromogenes]